MQNVEKAQEYFGFSGGWRPQRIDGGAQEPRGKHSASGASGAHSAAGDRLLAQRAAAEHLEELLDDPARWQDSLPSWDEALYGQQGIWVRPLSMWSETVCKADYHGPRFTYIGE